MTIPFYGSTGALFNAYGKMGVVIKQQLSNLLAQNTNLTNSTTGVLAQLATQADIQAQIGNNYLSTLAGLEGAGALMQTIAQLYLNRLVFNDNPQPNQDLQTVNLPASLYELIRQMKANGQTVLAMTITLTPGPAFTNETAPSTVTPGNAVLVGSNKRPFDGLVLENSFGETLQIYCTADSYSGGATAFNETYSVTGENSQPDVFAYNWPLGSGCSVALQAVDGDTSNGSGNLLTNSGFATWANTPNVPDNWSLTVGAAGTNVLQQSVIVYSGANSLELLGDGSTLTSLQQAFNSSSGTTATLSAQTQYSFNFFLRRGGSAVTGILTVDLIDGNGNVIKDANNVANSFTVDLSTLSTSFASFNGCFRTPVVMPSSYSIRMHLTTALSNNGQVYVGKASLGQMQQLYVSGPFLNIHAGNQPGVLADYTTFAVANSRGAGGTLSTLQTLTAQLLSPLVIGSEYLIPSAAVPSIPDSVIN